MLHTIKHALMRQGKHGVERRVLSVTLTVFWSVYTVVHSRADG